MIRVCGLGGRPCAGKSTLFRALIKDLGGVWASAKQETLLWAENPRERALILGEYGEDSFGGTDRLSMAVQPVALETLTNWSRDPLREGWTVLFEGDRLFNLSFLQAIRRVKTIHPATWIILEAPDPLLKVRHEGRGDSQSEEWLRGRSTKVARIGGSLPGILRWKHETPEDMKQCVEKLKGLIRKV